MANKKKIIEFTEHFLDIAKREAWVFDYDKDDDSLAIRAARLSPDTVKQYVNNDEFAFYMNPAGNVEGIFIEYFLSNFVAHHKAFKDAVKKLEREKDGGKESVIELKKDEIRAIMPKLQEAMLGAVISGERKTRD